MGIKKVYKSEINGRVNAPSSKSVMQRAVALALLTEGKSIINNPCFADDGLASVNIITNLGVKKEIKGSNLIFNNSITLENKIYKLNCGESGLCIRMFSPILSLFNNKFILSGKGSLLERTVEMIENILIRLGAKCKSNHGFPPIQIEGPINGRDVVIDGSISSQFLSGLLLALPLCPKNSIIKVTNMKSRPYVNLTLKMIRDAGVVINTDINTDTFKIKGKQKYKPNTVFVEGDWSGASFMLTAGALTGEIIVNNLNLDSMQADIAILDVLELVGAEVKKTKGYIRVRKKKLNSFEFNISESPDLFAPIASLAASCNGKTTLYGTERLKYKESNRAEVIKKEFGKLGIRVDLFEDKVEIFGNKIKGGKVSANNDHRISMALALMGLVSEDKVEIDGWESVSKSYPDFFSDLKHVGGKTE